MPPPAFFSAYFQSSPVRTVPVLSGATRPANFQSSPARTVLLPLVPPSMSAERIASLPLATAEGPPPGVRSLEDVRVDARPPRAYDLLIRWSTPSEERRPASPVRR